MKNLQSVIIESLKSEFNAYTEDFHSLKIVQFAKTIHGTEYGILKIWRGRQRNPFVNYRFKADQIDRMFDYTAKVKESELKGIAEKAERKAKEKAEVEQMRENIQVGTILSTSWGYSMTIVQFFQVIERKGAKMIIQELEQNAEGYGVGQTMPIADKFLNDKKDELLITRYPKINSSAHLRIWDGKSKYYNSWD